MTSGFRSGTQIASSSAVSWVTPSSGNSRPHMIKTVIRGTNWDAEIADASIAIRELDPLAADYSERHASLMAELADLRTRKPTADRVDWTEVRNADGTKQTIVQMFAGLNFDGKRTYIGTCRITATREGMEIVTPESEIPHGSDDYTPEELAAARAKLRARGVPVPE
jgi:hypothetical protein